MKRAVFVSIFVLSFFLLTPTVTFGQVNPSCPSVYGAKCPSGVLFIDKKVKNPQTGELVESLSANGPTFLPGQEVSFRVEVKNNGSADMSNIQVQDKLPDFVDFISGSGNFDKSSRTLNWNIDKLKPGEFKLFDLKVQVRTSKDLPDLGLSCVTNFAQAQQDKNIAQDSSVFCIQTKVLGAVPELPKTGPQETTIILIGSSTLLIMSIYLFLKGKRLN